MFDSTAWPAPAKLNLMLRIVGRRGDGYHDLQTVFQFLSVGDLLHFEVRGDGRINHLNPLPGMPVEHDLCVRAARLLGDSAGSCPGVDIRIEKRLPIGGGLGGGSSDAATTLHALNRLWGLALAPDELMRLGLSLGADVPVFVAGLAAWAEGVGERLQPLALPEPWYLVVKPACEVSTAAVFQDPELTRDSPRIKIPDFLAGARDNDCLPVVRRKYAEVAAAYDWLREFGEPRLTGTGACVFVDFERESAAREVAAGLPDGWQGMVAQGRNRSPLLNRLAMKA